MNRAKPLWMIVVALLAAMSLLVAAGCGDDAEEVVSQAESVATQAQSEVESVATDAASEGQSAMSDATTGDAGTTGGGGAAAIEIPADEQALAYQKESATAQAGEVTLRMPNPSPIPHNIAVDEPEMVLGEVVNQGGVSEITVDFPAGDYEYYCSVPGHREAGMVGTLTVQ